MMDKMITLKKAVPAEAVDVLSKGSFLVVPGTSDELEFLAKAILSAPAAAGDLGVALAKLKETSAT